MFAFRFTACFIQSFAHFNLVAPPPSPHTHTYTHPSTQGKTLYKPIIYGNVAHYFGKKRDEDGHTHSWTCFFRPFKSEDMSVWIKKVQFKLHESYNNPVRICTKPPYEVKETGWGEFEIQIKIYFQDTSEKPVTIYHLLKLFQADPLVVAGKKNVVSEQYDEVVFTDPTNVMFQLLTNPKAMVPAIKHEAGINYKDREEKTLAAITNARKKITNDIHELSERLKANRESVQKLKEQIEELEENG